MDSSRKLHREIAKWKRRAFSSNAAIIVVSILLIGGMAWGISTNLMLNPGDSVTVTCAGTRLSEYETGLRQTQLFCRGTTTTSTSTTTTTTTTPSPTTTPTTTPPSGVNQPPLSVTNGTPWRSIFADEFGGIGVGVDYSKWNIQNNSTFGDGNNEDQTYMAANVVIEDGYLKLIGKPDLTSGMVTTRNQGGPQKFKFRHGYIEARYKVPRGAGYWPAFWLVGAQDTASWPAYGEFDISEIYGPQLGISESNAHFTGGNIGSRDHNVGSTYDFHTYGLLWTSNKLVWYIDGVAVRTFNATTTSQLTALNYEHSPILNLAIGGDILRNYYGYDGTPPPEGAMVIDYVRAFQP